MPVRLGICLNLSRSADYSYAGFTKGRTLLGSLSSRAQQADSLAKSRDPVFSSSKICGEPAQRQPSAAEAPIVAGDCGSAEAEPFRKPNQRRFRFLGP